MKISKEKRKDLQPILQIIHSRIYFTRNNTPLNPDIKSALNLTPRCTAFQHLITQSLWKVLLERDFPDIKLSLALCTRETYASLFQQKIASENTEKELREKISALKNNLDKCTTSLKNLTIFWNDLTEG